MKNTIKFLFTIILLLTISNVQAQSHTFAPGWCKLAKAGGVKGESASLECQACNAKDKKEIEAKAAENKRRDDAIVAKAKAENDARQAAWKAKQLEDAKNAHSGEVYINGNTIIAVKTTTIRKQEKPKTDEKNIFYALNCSDLYTLWGYFYSTSTGKNGFIVNSDTIFSKNEFNRCIGLSTQGEYSFNSLNFPPNIGIVILNKVKIIPPGKGRKVGVERAISDLVDSKGNRILNDDNISAILHFSDDYFILLKGDYTGYSVTDYRFDDAEIFNLKTKETIPIQKNPDGLIRIEGKIHTSSKNIMNKTLLKQEGSYRAFIRTEVGWEGNKVIYYINNNGTVEKQQIVDHYSL